MGLLPLEYTECLTDTPHFREKLRAHEKELDRTSQAIKGLIKEVKDLLSAAKNLSKAQRSLAATLINFQFDCIGCSLTDDEIVIAESLKEFGRLLSVIEDERDRMLDRAQATFIDPVENFRKENIGAAKEGKKKFDKETTKFCQSLERHLNLSIRKGENHLLEADASLEMEQRHFFQAALDYIFLLTEIQERKKFEFVETVLSFMCGIMTFYHQGYEVANEFQAVLTDLQRRIQRIRENFQATHNEAEQLKQKTLEKAQDPGTLDKMYTRQGYLFLMEKKHITTTWIKHFCQYQKSQKKFSMMPYSQTTGKIVNGETFTVKECVRRHDDSIDKRFCFDLVPDDKPTAYTFQALSDEDRKLWLDAMDGKEPTSNSHGSTSKQEEFALDDNGFSFVLWCINFVESRGLTDHGLYRIVGVNSKVSKLVQIVLDRRKDVDSALNEDDWEVKTVTSALKNYFRNLPEPLLTFRLHGAFIAAAKQESKTSRVNNIHALVHSLPHPNFQMLEIVIRHLHKVAKLSDKNLMTVSNLGVCFGPTLLRPEEETVAAIMDIKFGNIVVEILIENCEKIFGNSPDFDGLRRKPPPYVPPPQPVVRREAVDQRSRAIPPAANRMSTPEGYNNRATVPHSTFPSNNSPTAYPITPHSSAPPDQKNRGGLIVYNPIWNDGKGFPGGSMRDSSVSHRGPPPRPPLPDQQPSDLYPVILPETHRAEAVGSIRTPSSTLSDAGSRDYFISGEVMQDPMYIKMGNNSNLCSGKKVRTLYACRGENEMELSFEPNEIIYNVLPSEEPGWIRGTLRGKTGLVPENYVDYIP